VPSGVTLTLAGFRSRWTIPFIVCSFESLRDLPRDRQRLVEWHRAARESLRQILARDQLHRQEIDWQAVIERRHLEAVDVGDVGMIEGGEEPGFAFEAGDAIGVLRDCRG
jgi:hypothetical protein